MVGMRLTSIVLLTLLAAACVAAADDGAVVPLSDLKKSTILKKKPAPAAPGQAPTTAPASIDDESTVPPAIPELPHSSSSTVDIPAVPDVPASNGIPSVPDLPTSADVTPNSSSAQAENYSDEATLPAPMGTQTAAPFGTRDMLGKKTIPVTMPRDQRIIRTKMQLNALPENSSVVGQPGRIYKGTDGWYWVKYDGPSGKAPLAPQRLLLCRILQSVEEQLTTKPDTLFKIYGHVMIYDGMAYLLLRRVTIEDGTKPVEETAVKPVDPSVPASTYKTPGSTTATAAAPSNSSPSSAAEAIAKTDNILASVMRETEGRAIRTSNAPVRTAEENKTSVAPAGQTPLSQGRENLVVDRLARVVKSKHADWYEVHFVSDNTLREPPYLVLPNSRLEESQRLNSYLGYHDRKLRVSGEVIFYKGRRYILLTKVFPERDMRQF